jgi:hypothetical protein
VLHPVGPLPASVYWRRRVLALTLLLSVLGGAGWLGGTALRSARADGAAVTPVAAAASRTVTVPPALEQVVPSLAGVQTPAAPTFPTASSTAPLAGGPCSDAMLSLAVHAPTSVAVGSRPEFDLVVTNVSPVPCVRALDKGLQEVVLLDLAGSRIWGSNDCSPETSADQRTLAPGQAVSFPVLWAGLTSEPTCTAPRVAPGAGSYLLRGRLDTLVGPDTPVTLT